MEDAILLKPNPARGLPYLLIFPLYAAALVAMALTAQPTAWLPLFLTVLGLLGMLILGVGVLSMFRTFRLSREGITISLFRFHRFYPWSDFTIHYESYRDPLMVPYNLRDHHAGAVVIPRKSYRFKKPKNWDPETYCELCHPFTYVYLHFPEDEADQKNHPISYVCSKEEFVKKMSVFGVLPPTFFEELKQIPKQS